MKAIGKGSLASILAAGLHVVRIVIFICFFVLSIAAIAMPLAPILVRIVQNTMDLNINGNVDVDAGDYVELLHHFVTFGVLLYIVNRLLEILRTLRFGSPFVKENADRFRRVGFALLIGEGAKLFFVILGKIFNADVSYGTELMTWVGIICVFVLAEVFREGAKMKEEQDLTV